jgi:hypothetical protein
LQPVHARRASLFERIRQECLYRSLGGGKRTNKVGALLFKHLTFARDDRLIDELQKTKPCKLLNLQGFVGPSGGGGEIRTHGRITPSPVFKTGALNRSATPPSPKL